MRHIGLVENKTKQNKKTGSVDTFSVLPSNPHRIIYLFYYVYRGGLESK